MADTPNTPPAATAAAAVAASPSPTPAPVSTAPDPVLVAAPDPENEPAEDNTVDDGDSALGDDAASSTNSITSSILEYRTIAGRTYHSDRHNSKYFTPNDEQQMQSQDITHHYLGVLLEDKLFLPPVKEEDLKRVLDVGTGTGIWAIDMADQYPNAEITGTDLSPTQPLWVPPNVRFEIDDCTQPWTWPDNHFDLIHMRYLFGAVSDWNALFKEAYRCCSPGGWVQSVEIDCDIYTDDGTIPPDSVIATFWNHLYRDAGKKLGVSFQIIEDGIQTKELNDAGFVDIQEANHKIPIGGWPQDPRLAEVGQYVQLTMLNDLDGYTLVPWNLTMGEDAPGFQEMLAGLRKELKNRRIHSYMKVKYMYGRKPESA